MEEVYVVPAGQLPKFSGFMPADNAIIETIKKNGFFIDRSSAENDFSLKQIIPYTIFAMGGRIFTMRRLEKSGEGRLRGKVSIGIGGHINHVDEGLEDGMRREFFEEVNYEGTFEPALLGFINDDSDDVGKVHFGACYLVEGDSHISVKETDILEGRMLKPGEIDLDALEKWSRIALDNLGKNPLFKNTT